MYSYNFTAQCFSQAELTAARLSNHKKCIKHDLHLLLPHDLLKLTLLSQAVSKFFKGLDKRHLQQQIDVHRLFLLTSFQHRIQEGDLTNKGNGGQPGTKVYISWSHPYHAIVCCIRHLLELS